MIGVSAGIVRNKEGLILACRRGEGWRNAHLWEFPGGKREPGEDAVSCLKRELEEELSLPVEDVTPRREADEGGIRFTFLTAVTDAQPVATEHEAIGFFRARELLGLTFCPADAPVARALALNEPALTDLFWDYDGTLFDTYPMMTGAFRRACAAQGALIPAEDALALLKRSLGEAVTAVAEARGLDGERLMRDFRAAERETPAGDIPLTPGMGEALAALRERGCRHHLLTHRDRAALDALEAKGLLPLFTGIVTHEAGFPRKPDPSSLLHLMRAHGVDPARACMIGDRPLDVGAGRNAGILACLLDPEDRFPDTPCDLRARSAPELPDLLRPDPV